MIKKILETLLESIRLKKELILAIKELRNWENKK